ncbi:MAG: DNA-directed RNA polymerase subunit H [Candidatus Micrarchaeota archaeon]|nr:DNA-directed RNA polymerase subunit H [Candidatus Micrarchaeota archaeon]MDE1847959.1 DNA-directed RNA polymerase subunit H [Candidatus Micrarchaeota archaeon]MDE1864323.1 DNA-directed RNA polymerase subunit H [Candidatus Micrarchaeota archaeon]
MAGEKDRSITSYENLMVPKHEVLSDAEARKVLEELHTTAEKLPRIFDGDPALAGKAKPGQIVKIYREDPSGGYLYYRIVIQG